LHNWSHAAFNKQLNQTEVNGDKSFSVEAIKEALRTKTVIGERVVTVGLKGATRVLMNLNEALAFFVCAGI